MTLHWGAADAMGAPSRYSQGPTTDVLPVDADDRGRR
jgi:hypothetical protein